MAVAVSLVSSAEGIPLAHLAPGAEGVIEHVDGDAAIAGRLQDLGFVPGTLIRVLRRSPLGDPVEYELRGYRLCLRQSEAKLVRVRRTDSDAR